MLASNGAAQAQQAGMSFFVTSNGVGKGADLGGIEGADRHCQQLAQAAGAGSRTWHAYLSTQAADGKPAVNARDRIGKGPWQNSKGVVIAKDVDDLHSANNNLNQQTALTERGTMVAGVGMQPNWHDVMTGSQADGRAFQANLNLTCNNWSSSTFGSTMLGHIDRTPKTPPNLESWNAAHMSRSCSQPDLIATGGNGLFYCFAVQ
ncbi:MAG TPA: lectin [Xanthobacteraceae bacterium]|nr:lectin [Xanthobacteraceae bacterium]